MTVTCILVVLATLAIQCYSLYRRKAYDTHTDQMFVDIRRSLEKRTHRQSAFNPAQLYWVWFAADAGPVRQGNAANSCPTCSTSPISKWRPQRIDICERGDEGDWCIAEMGVGLELQGTEG